MLGEQNTLEIAQFPDRNKKKKKKKKEKRKKTDIVRQHGMKFYSFV